MNARKVGIGRWLLAALMAAAGCGRVHLIASSWDAGADTGAAEAAAEGGAGRNAGAGASGNAGVEGGAGTSGNEGVGGSAGIDAAGSAGSVGSSDAGDVDGPGAADGGAPPAPMVIASGSDGVVDLFATPAGLIVVHEGGVRLLDASGAEQAHLDFPGGITTAALDGDHLVVAERGRFTAMNLALQAGPAYPLTATCGGSALFDGTHFVCGPAAYTDSTLRTYDTATGKEISDTDVGLYNYDGLRIHPIPGRREMTVEQANFPSHYALLSVDALGVVTYINDFPYHGDFPVTHTLAFDSNPATHLIQETGLLLSIHGTPTFPRPCDTMNDGCFVQDGVLGTLGTNEIFGAMASRGDGKLYALVGDDDYDSVSCAASCALQVIDLSTRDFRQLAPYTNARLVAPIAAAVGGDPAVLYVGFDSTTDPTPQGYSIAAFPTQ